MSQAAEVDGQKVGTGPGGPYPHVVKRWRRGVRAVDGGGGRVGAGSTAGV